jgi:hypothetical protein
VRPGGAKSSLSPLLLIAAALLGCPEKSSNPPGDERLLTKLKAEKEREAKEGPIVPPTNVEPAPKDDQVNPLAEFAAKGTQKRELTLPAKTMLQVGKASLRLNALEASHTVGQGISVTTDDWFVMVAFNATGPEGTQLDLTTAHLERDGKEFPHARDAQAAGKKPGRATLSKDTVLTAYFEVPLDALGPGLTLVMPDGASTAKLELQ